MFRLPRLSARYLAVAACLALAAVSSRADNLLLNPDFGDGTEGWTLGPNTTVAGFPPPPGGGVDLIVSETSSPMISQCVNLPDLAPDAILDLSLEITLLEGNSGQSDSFMEAFVASDCTGPVIAAAFSERLTFSNMEPDQTVGLTTTLAPPPQTGSVRAGQFAAGTESGVNVNFRNPRLEAEAPGPSPDFDLSSFGFHDVRAGGTTRGNFAVLNEGGPTEGPWTLTISAPPGVTLVCIDPGFECTGNGTSTLTITSSADPSAFAFGFMARFDIIVGEGMMPGFYEIDAMVWGGGASQPALDQRSVAVQPPRNANAAPEDPPVTTNGRGQ